uniref:Very long-chain fatty acid transport protein n=1 Tax=Ciona intestinalis TaxID=7719 RepID=F6U4H3_CIOIN
MFKLNCVLPYAVAVPAGFVLLWQLIKRWYPWIPEDFAFLSKLIRGLRLLSFYRKNNIAVCDRLAEVAKATPDHPFLVYEDDKFSYMQMHKWVNKCGRTFRSMGVQPKDKVGLMMMNEPAFIAVWLGCNRIGAICSFLNFNLRSKSLMHCIDLSDTKIIIAGSDAAILEALNEVESELKERGIEVYVYGEIYKSNGLFNILFADKEISDDIPRSWREDVTSADVIGYIFTSGTTGFPKAVNMDNRKFFAGAVLLSFANPSPSDVIYTSLPLYHSSGLCIGVTGAIVHGCTCVLRKKFSASKFWPDCCKYNVTIVQYIGEILRYVCKQPETPEDTKHSVRLIIGNGLRPDVWKQFLERYGADIHVLEFYAATEGNVGFVNQHNKFGCVGTFSPLLRKFGSAIIKFDVNTEELVRDKNGRPIRCGPNEPGLLVAKITAHTAISSYKGKKSLTEKKVLKNLFKEGDSYFNTGDLLMYDDQHRLYFCDRVGDTFRWKGENVSTNEVSDTVVHAEGIRECNVYGVQVPGHDGRAGMVTVVLESDELDCEALYKHVEHALPSYARPMFVRVQPELEVTGTFKQRKVNLQKEGFDLEKVSGDKLFYMNIQAKTYSPITPEIQKKIETGEIRL